VALITAGLALALSLPAAAASGPAVKGHAARAIVLLSIDDLRADAAHGLGFHRLREEAVDYTSADTAATWTLPSHATMLTGLLPAVHGAGSGPAQNAPLAAGVPYAPQLLRRAGFRTAGFVQAAYLDAGFGFARGFETYRCDHKTLGPREHTLADALAWVKAHRSERLFVFAHSYTVHLHPWLSAAREGAGPFACPLPVELKGALPEPPPGTPYGCSQMRLNYEYAVACADQEVDAFVQGLDALLPKESTLLIVTADHGESLCDGGDTGRRSHSGPPLPEQARVPLFVRFPGGRGAGTKVRSAVSLADLAPTILAEAGVALPPGLDGMPLPVESQDAGRVVLSQGKDWSSARRGSLRLTRFAGGLTRTERDGFPVELSTGSADGLALSAALDALPGEQARLRARFRVVAPKAPADLPDGVRQALRLAGYLP
jgi:arylsulfatase A-like enzyme